MLGYLGGWESMDSVPCVSPLAPNGLDRWLGQREGELLSLPFLCQSSVAAVEPDVSRLALPSVSVPGGSMILSMIFIVIFRSWPPTTIVNSFGIESMVSQPILILAITSSFQSKVSSCSLPVRKHRTFCYHMSKHFAETAPDEWTLVLEMVPFAACPTLLTIITFSGWQRALLSQREELSFPLGNLSAEGRYGVGQQSPLSPSLLLFFF